MKMININGPFAYFRRVGSDITKGRGGHQQIPEAEVLEDLAAALRKRDDLDECIRNMRRLLKEAEGG